AWLFQEGVMDAAQFKRLAPLLTARSYQYSFRVAGFGLPSGRFRVLDVVIDLGSGKPVVTYLRDLTRLGLPFTLEPDTPEQTVAKSEIRNPKPEISTRAEARKTGPRQDHGAGVAPKRYARFVAANRKCGISSFSFFIFDSAFHA